MFDQSMHSNPGKKKKKLKGCQGQEKNKTNVDTKWMLL